MKKFLLFLSLIFVMLFVSCGGLKNVKTIRENSLIYETYLEIPIKAKSTKGGPVYFYTDLNLIEIKEIINHTELEVGTMISEIYNDNYLLIERILPGNKLEYYIIIELSTNIEENYYFFTTPSSFLDSDTLVYVPLHMFEVDLDDSHYFEFKFDTTYEIINSQNDFISFYSKIDIYDVTSDANTITIKIINKDEIFIPKYGIPHSIENFVATFSEVNDKLYVTFGKG